MPIARLLLLSLLFLLGASSASAAGPARSVAPSTAAEPSWEQTLDLVARAVVTLRVRGTRDFDTERAGGSTGTGFVIDKEKGIILTNRHMVHAGPVIAEAVFLNHEEVDLEPIYRDPVHDFGFYRFDPSKVRFMEVAELELRPERARVGLEIRIVGNDSGEKISILDGTLARLDREAPDYGGATYNDFNTFYFQAASNTSGGSSGSPVVDRSGAVIALNAGSRTSTASAFYLPLERIVRAIPYVERGELPPRGTVQATFTYTPFDECRRLGLTSAAESQARARFPGNIGLLVVDSTVPGGPASSALQPGDILLELEDRPIGSFVELAQVLDGAFDRFIKARVERGGVSQNVDLAVQDLHQITPATWLELGRAVLHPLSYMQARNHNVPTQGVYVAQPGYSLANAGIPARSLIVAIEGEPVSSLDDVQERLQAVRHGERVRVRYHTLSDPRQERQAVVRVDHLWHPMRRCTLDPPTGRWPCRELPAPQGTAEPEGATITFDPGTSRAGKALARSLVTVHFQVPYPTAGLRDTSYRGAGLVVDAERGLVVTDRDTVPVLLGELEIGFSGQLQVPGRVVYLHPVQNLAVVQYDPALVQGSGIRAVRFVDRDVEPGDRVWQIALDTGGGLVDYETRVAQVGSITLGAARTPRFRAINLEGFSLTDSITSIGGGVADRRGRVIAGWLSFMDHARDQAGLRALPAAFITRTLDPILAGEPVDYRSLGVELGSLGLAAARDLGLSQERANAVLAKGGLDRRVFQIVRVWGGTPAAELLRTGDLLIAAQGRPLTRMGEIEALTAQESVDLTVLRDGQEIELALPTVPLPGTGVSEMIQWAGLILHEPHLEVAAQLGEVREGVYASWVWYGTPAYDAGIRPTRHIVALDGEPITSLDDLSRRVRAQRHGQAVRLTTQGLDGRIQVQTLKVDTEFWPAVAFRLTEGRWERVDLPGQVESPVPAGPSPPKELP